MTDRPPQSGRLPSFVLIGAMKAGTTTLYRRLGQHPQISLAANKEPDFFIAEKAWSRGLDWYGSLFAGAGDAVAVGEASTSYSKCTEFAGVPQRMATVLPDVRLLYLLRDPVRRIRSMYAHNVIMGRESRPIDTAVLEDFMYVDASRYAMQLAAYLAVFPRDRIHVVVSERWRADEAGQLAAVWRFLGLSESGPVSGDDDYNVTARRRVDTRASRLARSLPGYTRARELVPRRWQQGVYRRVTRPLPEAELSKATLAELRRRLAPDLSALTELLADPLGEWTFARGESEDADG
jgi:hypothetical protein